MSEEELRKFHNEVIERFDDWFNELSKFEGLELAGFHMKMPIYSKRYTGSITIDWTLTPQEQERRSAILQEYRKKHGIKIPVYRLDEKGKLKKTGRKLHKSAR